MSDIITLPGLVCTAIPHLQTLAHLILIYTSNIWKWLISTLYKSIVHISYVIMVIYLANHIPMNILKYWIFIKILLYEITLIWFLDKLLFFDEIIFCLFTVRHAFNHIFRDSFDKYHNICGTQESQRDDTVKHFGGCTQEGPCHIS